MLRKLGREMETQEEFLRARARVSDDEFYNLTRSLDDRGLDPWDVHNAGLSSDTQNLMLHEGRATVVDFGAVRERSPGGLFEERGGTFIDPDVVDVTRNDPLAIRVKDIVHDTLWDLFTTGTGHRARTRAAISGQTPGLYGRVMPTAVAASPAVPAASRLLRPLMEDEEEGQDVLLGPL
jgi:hypothetical protein